MAGADSRSGAAAAARVRRGLAALALSLPIALAGCAGSGARHGPDVDSADRGGRPADRGYVVVRSWEHELKQPDGRLERQVVEYGWDYARAVAVERTRRPDGQATGERDVVGETLRATEEEQAWAFDLVRRDPDLKAAATAPDVLLYGGFILMEPGDAHCHLRSRCVYVFASQGDDSRKVVEAIVDLQANRVVYPNYKPETTRPLN